MGDWPADSVERRSVESLIPYARNARTHSDQQIAQIAASIREWGWTNPVLVDETGGIIAGHGRVLAARKLSLGDVPVMVASGWSEAQKRAYILADNKLALNAGWDDDLLRIELGELRDLDFDLTLTGFGDLELDALLAEKTEGLTDPDELPEPPPATSELGDVWLLGRHRLVCGDSTKADDVERALSGVTPNLLVSDPPYGVSYEPDWRNKALGEGNRSIGKVSNDDRADWREAWALFPGDVAYVWHAGTKAGIVAESLIACGFEIRCQIIWAKQHFAISRGHYHIQHEPLWYAVRKSATGHWGGDRKQSTLWQINNGLSQSGGRKADHSDNITGHGTQKPVECMRRPIENNSSPGQAVYDPFVGSGSTIIAAEQSGRACHCLELDPSYADICVVRWMTFTGKQAILEQTGQTFGEVSAQRNGKRDAA